LFSKLPFGVFTSSEEVVKLDTTFSLIAFYLEEAFKVERTLPWLVVWPWFDD